MAGPLPRYDGFIPGQFPVDGYGAGGFQFAGMSHRGSILALPDGIHAWPVTDLAQVTEDSLRLVIDQSSDDVELLLIGTGANLLPIPAGIKALLQSRAIRSDAMATAHAISTYNILLGERRKVAAALIATL